MRIECRVQGCQRNRRERDKVTPTGCFPRSIFTPRPRPRSNHTLIFPTLVSQLLSPALPASLHRFNPETTYCEMIPLNAASQPCQLSSTAVQRGTLPARALTHPEKCNATSLGATRSSWSRSWIPAPPYLPALLCTSAVASFFDFHCSADNNSQQGHDLLPAHWRLLWNVSCAG